MGGGQPNLGNACILGASGPATPPLCDDDGDNVDNTMMI